MVCDRLREVPAVPQMRLYDTPSLGQLIWYRMPEILPHTYAVVAAESR